LTKGVYSHVLLWGVLLLYSVDFKGSQVFIQNIQYTASLGNMTNSVIFGDEREK